MQIIYKNKLLDLEDLISKKKEIYIKNHIMNCVIAIKTEKDIDVLLHWFVCQELNCVPAFFPPYFDEGMVEYINSQILFNFTFNNDDVSKKETEDLLSKYKIKGGDIIQFSSASTGLPKIIIRTRESLSYEVNRYIKGLKDLSKDDIVMAILPMFHSYGFVCGFMLANYMDLTLVINENRYHPRKVLNEINQNKVSIILTIPDILLSMTKIEKAAIHENVKHIISSSAHLKESIVLAFQKCFSYRIEQLFGCTEAGSLAFSCKTDIVNCFTTIFSGIEIEINDHEEILVKSEKTMGYYIKNEKLQLIHPYFNTGEKGCLLNGLVIKGRQDNVINIGGKKYSQKNLCDLIEKYEGIVNAYVKLSEKDGVPVVIYEIERNKRYDKDTFRQYCIKNIPDWLQPNIIMDKKANWKNGA